MMFSSEQKSHAIRGKKNQSHACFPSMKPELLVRKMTAIVCWRSLDWEIFLA